MKSTVRVNAFFKRKNIVKIQTLYIFQKGLLTSLIGSLCVSVNEFVDLISPSVFVDFFNVKGAKMQIMNYLISTIHQTNNTIHHFANEMCTFLFLNCTLWDVGLVHSGICSNGVLINSTFVFGLPIYLKWLSVFEELYYWHGNWNVFPRQSVLIIHFTVFYHLKCYDATDFNKQHVWFVRQCVDNSPIFLIYFC